jgi:chaperonin GroEL
MRAPVRAIPRLEKLDLDGDARTGARIVALALREPLRVIAGNAGLEGAVVVNHVAAAAGDDGFNAVSETYGNLVEQGVIDPTKVVVSALTNATSIATMIITTEALVADVPEREDAQAAAGHSHGGGMPGMGGMGGMGGMDDDMDF